MSSGLRIQQLWWYDNVLLEWDVQAITRIRKHNKTHDLLVHVYNVSGFYMEKLYKKIIPSFFCTTAKIAVLLCYRSFISQVDDGFRVITFFLVDKSF